MNLFEQLRLLDPNDPGSWPVAIKAGALTSLLIAIVVIGYFLDWQEQSEILERVKAEEVTLKETYLIKKRNAVNLDIMRQQLQELEQTLSIMLKQLPNKSEIDALLVDINRAGLGRGLQFELFKPAASETIKEIYAELPVTVRVIGNYHDIGAFASDVSQLPRIVTLNDLNITPGKEQYLVLNAVAKTFRYLDDEELANQKKSNSAGNK
ncbi:type 4a pilus biogenesis protein PilO [Nitrosomonas sp. Is37]|uniref:type 4a pilus biogenesis protein PilO n=1 Tax=Nitrosomonas sp. Is37 TaxID=3080535 RepID=UPI00294B8BE4|nr:type 4a pilus biogenesis protein PilO [Nitrosomonas sp. Is37]MDV6344459.1 type 4a pilus biogenesis protein PilO [Nitrosomonas sp. Is37]